MHNSIKELLQLFFIFFRIGLFSIGGGYVMLPMLRREMVETRGWLTDEQLIDFYAIAQATPGIIAINTATFVGFRRRSVAGACAATLGMVAPSLIIITAIALFFDQVREVPVMERAFRGVRIAVAMLLSFTLFTLIKKTVLSLFSIVLFLAALAGVAIFDLSPVPILLAAAAAGILFGILRRGRDS